MHSIIPSILCSVLHKSLESVGIAIIVMYLVLLCPLLGWGSFPSLSRTVEDLYESVNDREIRQVFEGQNRIHLEIKQLNRQLAMILDEQRRYVSVITEEVSKRGAQTQSGQV